MITNFDNHSTIPCRFKMVSVKYFDIGSNFTDKMFKGIYNGKKKHLPDLMDVVRRSINTGMEALLITSSCAKESNDIIESIIPCIHEKYPTLYIGTTLGVHPCSSKDVKGDWIGEMEEILRKDILSPMPMIKSLGELGLDYDRLFMSDKETQLLVFKKQFFLCDLSKKLLPICLPLFLHMRAASDDFFHIIKENRHRFDEGVVHSFTGTIEDVKKIIELNLYIGINGCSLRSEESLSVVSMIPLSHIMVESDAPWCEIKKGHAFATKYKEISNEDIGLLEVAVKAENLDTSKEPKPPVKGRNEPWASCKIIHMLSILHNLPLKVVESIVWENSMKVFGPFK